ncbi:Palmitoyltransferase [Ascosphaera pollenicola]|nr:Palmitoyltransferase [Ascosphaera pollenicola]
MPSNMTTIESWEIERHEMLVRRARASGGYLSAPDGTQIRIRKQEFPYDLGFFKNVKEAMGGSANVLRWFWPFSDVPSWNKGVFFETNGFEADDNVTWPPPDPERMAKSRFIPTEDEAFTYLEPSDDPQSRMEAFRRRQQQDLLRRRIVPSNYDTGPRAPKTDDVLDDAYSGSEVSSEEDLEHWTNSEGERLRDFGVDEEVDLGDEDDIPLAKLMERWQQAAAVQRSRQ